MFGLMWQEHLLKVELKRKGVAYSQLVDRRQSIGVDEKEVNVRNKLSRGKIHGGLPASMSKGDRGAIFAIGLVAGVALALFFFVWAFPWFGDPTQGQDDYAGGNHQGADQAQEKNDAHFWVRPWLYADDSLAQWLMAALGVVAAGISAWAVLLVRDSLAEARKTTKAALDAAEANRLQRTTNRPFLTPINYQLRGIGKSRESSGGPSHLQLHMDIENVGDGPAFLDRYGITHAITLIGNAPALDRELVEREFPSGVSFIRKDAYRTFGACFHAFQIEAAEWKQIAANRRSSVIFGYIQYTDTFKVARRSGFCFDYLGAAAAESENVARAAAASSGMIAKLRHRTAAHAARAITPRTLWCV
jgi:hypothetical protein